MVTTQSAPAMAMRLRTSPAGKLSAMDTTRDPAPDDGQVGGHAFQGQGHVEGDGLIWRQAAVDETIGKPVDEALEFAVGRDGERASI